jgi:hypothetical protein|tara:strand:- start:604 stop:1539 length:936 start_codon:yes stop_codon:yes gene_type:complete
MDWSKPLKLWNGDDVARHFPMHGPHKITFDQVRSLSIISNYLDEIKNTTVNWFPCDTEEMWEDNKKSKLKDLKKSGWMNDDGSPIEIKYHINKHGFRYDGHTDKIEPGGILYIGDSNVFGIANHYDYNYTLQAHKQSSLKDKPYYNWGMGGRNIETYYRILKMHIEEYKPYGVFVDFPWASSRCDTLNSHDEFHGLILGWLIEQGVSEKIPQREFEQRVHKLFALPAVVLRWHKNMDAIKYLCYKNNAKCWIYDDPELWGDPDNSIMRNLTRCTGHWDEYRFARDLVHTNETWHDLRGAALAEILDYVNTK